MTAQAFKDIARYVVRWMVGKDEPKESAVDALIAERRAEAARENEDA